MVTYRHLAALCALALLFVSCRNFAEPVIDRASAALLTGDTRALAGLHLRQLRASPLYPELPPAVRGLAEPYGQVSDLVLAFDGKNLLSIVYGPFGEPPPGTTRVDAGLAVGGAPGAVRAAMAQYYSRPRRSGAGALLAQARAVAHGKQIWLVAQGGGANTLPLTGNWDNVNGFLHATDYLTLAARIDSAIEIEAAAICSTEDGARRLEETARAMLTLAEAGARRDADLVALLRGVRLTREERTVRANLSASPEGSERLLRQLAR